MLKVGDDVVNVDGESVVRIPPEFPHAARKQDQIRHER
jgi:hypothetical protein